MTFDKFMEELRSSDKYVITGTVYMVAAVGFAICWRLDAIFSKLDSIEDTIRDVTSRDR